MGNFICDLMRTHYGGDCCLIAAGTIRGDQIYPPGVLKAKDVMNCFPFEDPCVVIKVNGQALFDALENSVSLYPALEGRFPQVSNIEFEFDPSKPANSRVLYVNVAGKPLDKEKLYVLVTRGYMARGKDGFDSLLVKSEGGEAEEIVSEENGILISMIIRQYFMSLKILGKWKNWGKSMDRHWKGVQDSMQGMHPVVDPSNSDKTEKPIEGTLDDSDDDSDDTNAGDAKHDAADETEKSERRIQLARKVTRKWRRLAGLKGSSECCDVIQEFKVDWTRVSDASLFLGD